MGTTYLLSRIWALRTVPAYILLKRMDADCRRDVYEDMARLPFNGFMMAMSEDRNFRTIFYARAKVSLYRSLVKRLLPPNKNIDLIMSEKIGGGLMLLHSSGMTVWARSIGKNVTIHQGVTIGKGRFTNADRIPTIGNDVYIGANAIIIGGINVGDGARIGAGAVVVKDVPPGVTVVGNPARIVG